MEPFAFVCLESPSSLRRGRRRPRRPRLLDRWPPRPRRQPPLRRRLRPGIDLHSKIAEGDPVEAAAFRPPKQRERTRRALAPGSLTETPSQPISAPRSETAPTPSPFRALAISSSSPTPASETSPSSAPPATPPRPPQNRSTLHHAPRRQTPQRHRGGSVSNAVASTAGRPTSGNRRYTLRCRVLP